MSQDKEREARPEWATAPDGTTFSRRHFLQSIGVAAGVVAAGVIPAVLTAPSASAEDATATTALAPAAPGAEGDQLAAIIKEDAPANYPGRPVYYADPA